MLEGVDLVVFDKDGTLIDFHAMWGGWARDLGDRLEGAVRRPVAPDVFAAIGFDPVDGRVAPGGPLAIGTMADIESTVETVMRRWCPSVTAARRAVESAWTVPDPVTLAVPLADLPALFRRIADETGRRIAVVTTDDRDPTDATLRHLGVRAWVRAMVCGDDGFAAKPAPDPIFALCQAMQTTPDRVAVIGDTPADIAMGRAAGARHVYGVRTGIGRDDELADADLVLESIASLVRDAPLT
ncbi:MAG TPA: HAD family hydrolase [Candidatus Saccharimonadales bacterium]|nr:HAD family hydrolase [Candidatus Saccharimonadales bacterium]